MDTTFNKIKNGVETESIQDSSNISSKQLDVTID
jgi:hypothetical protein